MKSVKVMGLAAGWVVALALGVYIISSDRSSDRGESALEKTASVQKADEFFDPQQAIDPNTTLLTTLAGKHGTDKGMSLHGYSEVYEYFLYPLKNSASRIFEIGVLEGASLRMWRDYFPKASIHGIDIADTSRYDGERLKTYIADQGNRQQLQTVMDASGGDFDVIVDDGGHSMDLQQVSLGFLFPYVKSGGYYILEDVHTSIYARYKDSYGANRNEKNTTLAMIDHFIRTGEIESKYMTSDEEKYAAAHIRYCALVSRNDGKSITCIFKKE